MIVGKRMSSPIKTVAPDLPIMDAVRMMKEQKIRHIVVIDKGKMVGLVTKNDLDNAMPSKATTLSIWELNYLVDKITVGNVMVREVISVVEETPIEEAARIMVDKKISCLPVLRGDEAVGIITETDLFQIFLELLGARQKGVRLSAEISVEPGSLAKLTQAIYKAGGDIIAIGTFKGETVARDEVTLKVQGVDEQTLRDAVAPHILKLFNLYTV